MFSFYVLLVFQQLCAWQNEDDIFMFWDCRQCHILHLMSVIRDRPAAIQIEVKSIDDTSNFDEFPDIDLKWREFNAVLLIFVRT